MTNLSRVFEKSLQNPKTRYSLLLSAFLFLSFSLAAPLFTNENQEFTLHKIQNATRLTWEDLSGDFNPPTFFLFLSIFSQEIFGVILLSFFASLIGILLIFHALSDKFDQTNLFLGLFLFIFSPLGNNYLFGVRPPAFSFMFSALVFFFYNKTSDPQRFQKMVIAAAIATYFSYLNFFLLLVVLLIGMLERVPWKNFLPSVLALPAAGMLLIHYQYMIKEAIDGSDFWFFFADVSIHSNFISGALSKLGLWFAAVLIFIGVLFFIRKDLWGAFKVQIAYLIFLSITGIKYTTAFFPRYFFPNIYFVYVLFALKVKNKKALVLLAAISLFLSVVNYYRLYSEPTRFIPRTT